MYRENANTHCAGENQPSDSPQSPSNEHPKKPFVSPRVEPIGPMVSVTTQFAGTFSA